MKNNSEPIRNRDGKLICELAFTDGHWQVVIKRRDCVTLLDLDPKGSRRIRDCMATE